MFFQQGVKFCLETLACVIVRDKLPHLQNFIFLAVFRIPMDHAVM